MIIPPRLILQNCPSVLLTMSLQVLFEFVFLTSIWLCDKKTTLRWQIQGVSNDLFPDILRINIYWHFSGSNMTSKLTTEPLPPFTRI